MEIPGREITTLRTVVHNLKAIATYLVSSPIGSTETSDSISLDWLSLIWKFCVFLDAMQCSMIIMTQDPPGGWYTSLRRRTCYLSAKHPLAMICKV